MRISDVKVDKVAKTSYDWIMNIHHVLTQLSLSDREANIYTTLLELGQSTPLQLAAQTGYKRTTIYLDLESMKRRGLVHISFSGRRVVYVPAEPEKILKKLRDQEQKFREVMPYLRNLQTGTAPKPQIRFFHGREAVERVWREETFLARENRYISNIARVETLFGSAMQAYARNIRRGIIKHSKELVMHTAEDIHYAHKHATKNREIRVMPIALSFDIDIEMWGHSVGLFSLDDRSLLVITSKKITASFLSLFQLAWMSAKKPEEFEKKG